MSEGKLDRRVQRTRQLLQSALMQLVNEKGYDAITIQDITERANLGRTTFYLHYQSKDELLLEHYADFRVQFSLNTLTREQLLGDAPQTEMTAFLEQIAAGKNMYFAFIQAKDSGIIMEGIRQQIEKDLRICLENAFPEQEPTIALEVLANYIAGAQVSLIDWWMNNRTAYSPQDLATMLHRLQRAAIRDAYTLK